MTLHSRKGPVLALCMLLSSSTALFPQVTSAPPAGGAAPESRPDPRRERVGLIRPRHFAVSVESLERLAGSPRGVPARLTAPESAALRDIAASIRSRRAEAAIGLWSTLLRGLQARGAALELDDLILFALREAYLPSSLELKALEVRLKTLDGQRKKVRAELARLRQASQAAYPAKEIAALEDKERRLGRDLDMASMEFQTALQEQQRLVTVIGTVGKQLEDTWPPTVRKEG